MSIKKPKKIGKSYLEYLAIAIQKKQIKLAEAEFCIETSSPHKFNTKPSHRIAKLKRILKQLTKNHDC